MRTGFLTESEIAEMGFRKVGENVRIDRSAIFYGAGNVSIGSHSRIDAHAIISAGDGGIVIGKHVHVAVFAFLTGAGRIEVCDFAGLSGRVSVYSSNDDYSGTSLTGPTVPMYLRNVTTEPVRIGRHAVVGAGSTILPGGNIGDGACVGAHSIVKRNVEAFMIVAGHDARVIGERKKDFLALEFDD
jgi:acetyltransferase-like isoleucine patch superfamily enzyme